MEKHVFDLRGPGSIKITEYSNYGEIAIEIRSIEVHREIPKRETELLINAFKEAYDL